VPWATHPWPAKTPPWPEPELRQRYRNRAAAFRAVGSTPMATKTPPWPKPWASSVNRSDGIPDQRPVPRWPGA
jgi:hypothetical protein